MSTRFWQRAVTALRDRYARSALAQYGAGLTVHDDEDDVGGAPDTLPSQRRHDGAVGRSQPSGTTTG